MNRGKCVYGLICFLHPKANKIPSFSCLQLILKDETTPGEYLPDVTSDPSGANWFDSNTQMLHVCVRGSAVVDIVTIETIFISFDLPYMTEDEFYGEQIVENLALYLDIPEDKIKVAVAVREDGQRRKRAVYTQVTIYIIHHFIYGTIEPL